MNPVGESFCINHMHLTVALLRLESGLLSAPSISFDAVNNFLSCIDFICDCDISYVRAMSLPLLIKLSQILREFVPRQFCRESFHWVP